MNLKGKNVVVTSAANGIGAAAAYAFAKAGCNVAINYFSSKDQADALVEKCSSLGVKAIAIQADVTDERQVSGLAQRVKSEFGGVDILINNAGLAKEPSFEEMTKEDILTALNNSLISTMIVTKSFVPTLITKGVVLNISTIYGLDQSGSTGLPVYSAAKAGVINFTQTMAKKYAPDIRFNVVAPGFTLTAHWDDIDEKVKKECLESTLQKEWVTPEDIADALIFLARSSHINSQTIVVDAGWSKR